MGSFDKMGVGTANFAMERTDAMCYDDDAHPPIPLSEDSQARGEDVTLTAEDGNRFAAYLATPGGEPTAQVVILPDVRGLHRFYRELALRFADVGLRALAIDYFGRTARDVPRDDSFDYLPHVEQMTPEHFRADINAAIDFLQENGDGGRRTPTMHRGATSPRVRPTFTVGFCAGGSMSFRTGTGDRPLAGVIGFYAGLSRSRGAFRPVLEIAGQIKAPVLGLFGGADQGIPQSDVDAFERELEKAGIEHEIVVYPGAPHSFFDRKATDFALESADAWTRVQGFIAEHGAPVRV
jgi:carboxymethylenebutenolidase